MAKAALPHFRIGGNTAMISPLIKEQIIETANDNIVSVIGDYVKLTKRGSSYVGCCPFHSEKTPSFSVSQAKGFYHCFGCHKSGNAVGFVMELEKMSFPDALRYLGKRFGISVPDEEATPEETRAARERDALFAVMEYATRRFESNLRDSEEGQALGMTYWRSRGFRDDTIATFRLGYSLNQRDGLMAKALADGYKEEALIKTGLISAKAETGYKHDYFRGRVMFPIQNTSGKVIGFGGRVLDAATKGVSMKYLNTPETELYNKRDTLYGIYQARSEIGRQDKCYLVEGYTDVIAMHQSGIANVVASSGTALTSSQIRLIKRYTDNVTVLYDGDSAGIHASLRGIDMILHEGMNVRVLLLPDGDDPDSFSRKHSADDFIAYVKDHEVDFITYEAQTLMTNAGGDPLKKAEATHTIIASIAEVQDQIKREFFVKECSRSMGVSEATLYGALQKRLVDNATRVRDRDVAEQRRRQYAEQLAAERAARQPDADLPPDLSPSEVAMLQSRGLATTTPLAQPQPKPETAQPQETEMREVMRFFVTYTQCKMEETEGKPTVAQYIIEALDADQITAQDPILRKIIDEYRNADDPSAINERHYIDMDDAGVASFVASAVGGRQHLSKIHSKYSVVKDEGEMLDTLVPRAVDELRMRVLTQMIDALMAKLNASVEAGAPEEEIEDEMRQLADLNEVKRSFSIDRLGERAIIK